MLEGASKFKKAISKTLEAALEWTNALLPEEQRLDDTLIGGAIEILDRIIPDPDPAPPV